MSEPHPDMLATFERWRLAELSSHYANNCPDEVMDRLTEVASAELDAVAAIPAKSAEDMLLKLAILAIVVLEPKCGDRPLDPVDPEADPHLGGHETALWKGLLADLSALCPAFASARRAPHYSELRNRRAA